MGETPETASPFQPLSRPVAPGNGFALPAPWSVVLQWILPCTDVFGVTPETALPFQAKEQWVPEMALPFQDSILVGESSGPGIIHV